MVARLTAVSKKVAACTAPNITSADHKSEAENFVFALWLSL